MRKIESTFLLIAVALVCIFTNGCSTCCAHKCCNNAVISFDNYTNYFCSWTSKTKIPVYVCDGSKNIDTNNINTNQPAIVVLHELPGMTPQCLSLATNIATRGYTVYLPLMFGKPTDDHTVWYTVCLWIDPDWYLFHKHKTPRIIRKLRIITNEIEQRQSVKPMGVVGMCLTGTLPLALLSDTNVDVVVLSQPAIPFSIFHSKAAERALALSPGDLEAATNRVAAERIKVMGLRFASDWICSSNRFNTLTNCFGANFVDLTIPMQNCKTNSCSTLHSVLCEQYDNTWGSPTRERFEEVITNFNEALKSPYSGKTPN